jgi:hypothetical protein
VSEDVGDPTSFQVVCPVALKSPEVFDVKDAIFKVLPSPRLYLNKLAVPHY